MKKDDETRKAKEYEESSLKPSLGYGGKFGVQNDRVDKVKKLFWFLTLLINTNNSIY